MLLNYRKDILVWQIYCSRAQQVRYIVNTLTALASSKLYFVAGLAGVFAVDGDYLGSDVGKGPQVVKMARRLRGAPGHSLVLVAARLRLLVDDAVLSHRKLPPVCSPELYL